VLRNDNPNILLIVLDTVRRDRLSAYGNPRETSPELDAFAARATLFERAIAPAQWTTPSHASMFTGLYPSVHRVTQGNSKLAESIPTLAEILGCAGYHTVAFCNNALVAVLDNGLRRGFEHFYSYAGAAPNRPVDARHSPLRRALAVRFRRFARRVENQFARSDRLFCISMYPWLVPIWTRYINYKGHTEQSVNDLIDYWRQYISRSAEHPLFVFLNLMGTHLPYNPPRDAIVRVAPELRNDRYAHAFMHRFNTNAARWSSPPDPPLKDWERAALRGFHDAEIAHQDGYLGHLLNTLRGMGALDNTLVIIVADHGELHGDHGFFGHGFAVYQELVHVPLIISGERFPRGVRVSTNVSTRRIFYTVLEAAGLKPPLGEADPNADVARLTLANATDGHPDAEEGVAYTEAYPPKTILSMLHRRNPAIIERLQLGQVRRGVYNGNYKLTTVGERVEGLYAIDSDPTERCDVACDYPELVAELQHKIDEFIAEAERQRADGGTSGEINPELKEHLRALGYMD